MSRFVKVVSAELCEPLDVWNDALVIVASGDEHYLLNVLLVKLRSADPAEVAKRALGRANVDATEVILQDGGDDRFCA